MLQVLHVFLFKNVNGPFYCCNIDGQIRPILTVLLLKRFIHPKLYNEWESRFTIEKGGNSKLGLLFHLTIAGARSVAWEFLSQPQQTSP